MSDRMKSRKKKLLEVTALSVGAAFVGCGGSEAGLRASDAAPPDGYGGTSVDGAGSVAHDSGLFVNDATPVGSAPLDAGPAIDAGISVQDAGSFAQDAGTFAADAGSD